MHPYERVSVEIFLKIFIKISDKKYFLQMPEILETLIVYLDSKFGFYRVLERCIEKTSIKKFLFPTYIGLFNSNISTQSSFSKGSC